MGKPALQFDKSRVSRGQNNDQDRPTPVGDRTPVGGRPLTPKIGQIEKQYP